MSDDSCLSIPELCDRWDVSRSTVARLIAAGKLAYFRIGGQYRIPLAEVHTHERPVANHPKAGRRPARSRGRLGNLSEFRL